MSLPCEEAAVLISARLDGALTAQEQDALDAHLALCPDCAALARSLAALSGDFAAIRAETAGALPPADLTGRITDAVRAEKVVPFPAKKPSPWKRWAAAAAVAVIVCAGALASGGPLSADKAAQKPAGTQFAPQEPFAAESDEALPESALCDPGSLFASSQSEPCSNDAAPLTTFDASEKCTNDYSNAHPLDLSDPDAARAAVLYALSLPEDAALTDEGLAPDGCARLFLLSGESEDEAALFADGAVLLRSDDPAAFDAAVGR